MVLSIQERGLLNYLRNL